MYPTKRWLVSLFVIVDMFLCHALARDNSSSFLGCGFEGNTFCKWENDHSGRATSNWTIWSGKTLSYMTGPQADSSGKSNGKYALMDAYFLRRGNTVRLLSPKIQGENCLSFKYHMYGGTMGSLIIYMKTNSIDTVQWIKSGNHPDHWFEAAVFLNSSVEYQIVLEGIRGSNYASDIAIDNISVQHGRCERQVTLTMHAFIKEDATDFKIDRVPAHSNWIHQFSLESVQTRTSSSDVMYFVYPGDETNCPKSVTRDLTIADLNCFPRDFFFASGENQTDFKRVLLVNRGDRLSYGITLDEYHDCCGQMVEDYFFANLSLPKGNTCPPGWYSLGESCFQLNMNPLKSWAGARVQCHNRGGKLDEFENSLTTHALSTFLDGYMEYWSGFHVGAQILSSERWITVGYQEFDSTSSLWGPGEPSGNGWCANMILGEKWRKDWRGKGWRLDSDVCNINLGFVCQKKKTTSASSCDSSWFVVEGICFRIYAGNMNRNWMEARTYCKNQGGDLAVVDSELKRQVIASRLDNINSLYPNVALYRVSIGVLRLAMWQWLGGRIITSDYWHRGLPDPLKFLGCAVLQRWSSVGWKLVQVQCNFEKEFLCQTKERTSVSGQSMSHSSHSGITGKLSYVTDGNIGSCLTIQRQNGKQLWWSITLHMPSFVYKIWVKNRQDCCFGELPELQIVLRNSEQTIYANCKVYDWKTQQKRLMICEPSIMATNLTIFASGADNVTLCEVMVNAAEDDLVAHGVLQELWYNIPSVEITSLQADKRFPNEPDVVAFLQHFDAPHYIHTTYGQRLTAYLLVPESGKYTFYVACNAACNLWLDTNQIGTQDKATEKILLAKLDAQHWTFHNQWERFPQQQSNEIFLSKCHLYRVEMLMKEDAGWDSASVGIRLPNGSYERPIRNNRLFWVLPGVGFVDFKIPEKFSIETGRKFTIQGTYKYCYSGSYSPNCPIDLSLRFAEQRVLVHSNLPMDCKEYKFNRTFETILQKGNYKINLYFSYVDTAKHLSAVSKEISEIFVTAINIGGCNFTSDLCSWRSNDGGWKLSPFKKGIHAQGKEKPTVLESPMMFGDPIYKSTGICLSFSYLLSMKSESSLTVFVLTSSNSSIWRLNGFHGDSWHNAQVQFTINGNFMVLFIAGGKNASNTYHLAVDKIDIASKPCNRLPLYSDPGFTCNFQDEFQCKNGPCVSKDLVCDGDSDCLDNSDESDCTCSATKFACSSGECISIENLCDSKSNCQDGTDEARCGMSWSKDKFSCASGRWISWALTCNGEKNCEDGADEPSACSIFPGFTNCSLLNVGCALSNNTGLIDRQKCPTNKVKCHFEDGFCGMKHASKPYRWQIGSGSTPTKFTGPRFDHTTLLPSGKYIFIESSDYETNSGTAVLASGVVDSSEATCIQFWYHMRGRDIGILNVYIRTNESRTLIWQLAGEQGDNWNFGQVGYKGDSRSYEILLEAVFGKGIHGDIAVDDLYFSNEEDCPTTYGNESPNCLFEMNHCAWRASNNWKISQVHPPTPKRQDWQTSKGGFTYFQDCLSYARGLCYANLKSPNIVPGAMWKCLQFWYFLERYGFTSLEVSLVSNETRTTLWSSNWKEQSRGYWSLVRVPMSARLTSFRVIFEGFKNSKEAMIALDDVVLQTDKCERIPWKREREDFGTNPLGAKYFWRLDGMDKAILWLRGTASYQFTGGIKSLFLDGRAGYADIPAIDFQKSNFSISIRFNVQDTHQIGHLISDWSSPFQFRLYIASKKIRAVLRRVHNEVRFLLSMESNREIDPNEWTHVVFVWNRGTRKGTLYLNGSLAGESKSTYTGSDIDLNSANHSTYELGFKKDTKNVLHGYVRDLAVFFRPLTPEEVFTLFSPTRAKCRIRRTENEGCCDFPFVYKNSTHNTCIRDDAQYFWCQEASFSQQQAKCAAFDRCSVFYKGVCGWANSDLEASPWRQVMRQETERASRVVISLLKQEGWNSSTGFAEESNFQLEFPANHISYVNMTDLPDLSEFTICFWMKTSDKTSPGTPLWYRVRYRNKEEYVTAIALIDYQGFYVYIGETKSKQLTSTRANDGAWHNICLVWSSTGGLVTFQKDNIRLTGNRFSEGKIIPGGGDFIVGITEDQAKLDSVAGQFIGTISHVNIFNKVLDSSMIKWMSHGCNEIPLDILIPWSHFKKGFVKNVRITKEASCADNEGYRYMVFQNSTPHSPHKTSLFESPIYERSQEDRDVCVRFRYLIYGAGRQFLRLYHQFDLRNHTRRLMWVVNETSDANQWWKYGSVTLPGGAKFRVFLEADLGTSGPGFVGVRGVHTVPGFCDAIPHNAVQDCGTSFTNSSGYIFSPHFPSYYPPSKRCKWKISVPSGNIIKLKFIGFQLEEHPSCSNDYIEVFDGQVETAQRLGRFCGERFPTFLRSSSNVVEIIFSSNNNITRSGFKLLYTSEKIDADHMNCIQFEGCPSSCVCIPVSPKSQDMVITVKEGRDMSSLPRKIPTNAAIILFQSNQITHVQKESFSGLSRLKYLDLSGNRIFRVDRGTFTDAAALKTLKLDMNFISTLSNGILDKMKSLQILDCSFNLIKEISSTSLASLSSLITLSLRSNRINKIDENAFNETRQLIYLYLHDNRIKELPNEVFHGLSRLKILDLSNNRIRQLFSKTFAGLSSLEKLNMQNNSLSLKNFPPDAFNGLRKLKQIYLDEFILCCYAEKVNPGVKCYSPKDEFSSCSDLMKNNGAQVCIWILGLTALLGNVFVIVMRIIVKEDNKVHSFLLTNLAISDLLMGIYLLIIAIKDVQWQGEYFKHDFNWRSGTTCELTGVLSMVSSEVSVLMLTLITTDRLICIVFPFKVRRMSRSVAYAAVGGIWAFGTMLSVIPILGLDYFYDKTRNVGFYGKSAVCLPLQLSAERQAGWEYAVGTYIGLNFVSFIYILVAYIAMFITVKSTSKKVRSTNINRESRMARRMVFIIVTDFLCWMPVILIGLLSLLRQFHDPEKQAYVWIAVFVLPVNSSINPILYTFSTPHARRKVKQMKNSLFSIIDRRLGLSRAKTVSGRGCNSVLRRNVVAPSKLKSSYAASSSSCSKPRPKYNSRTSTTVVEEMKHCGAPEKGLKIIETSNILAEETSNSVGFLVARRKNLKKTSMRLIKYFSSGREDDWRKESDLVNELRGAEHPNIIRYCWHCKAQECNLNYKQEFFARLTKNAFLLCYDLPESTPLDEYLKNKNIILNMDTLFVMAMDLIDAILCLENKGIVHNNITTSSVLIAKGFRVPPVKAILAGFGSSQLLSRDFPDRNDHTVKDILGKNIIQFGYVLSELMRNCHDSEKSEELKGVMHLCFEQDTDVRPKASQVKDLLRDLCSQNDIWDTSV